MSASLSTLPISDVHVEPGLNARRQEEQSALEALRDSVARHGVLQPLLVRPREQGGVWLVAGHRRLAAAQLAQLPEVPVVAVSGERLELTAVENLQRAQLSPLEETRAFRSLADAGHSRKGIAQALPAASPACPVVVPATAGSSPVAYPSRSRSFSYEARHGRA